MLVVLGLGIVLCGAGAVLLLNLFGARAYAIRRVTSQPLGELPPGYAASPRGLSVYAILVLAVGASTTGIGLEPFQVEMGFAILVLGVISFVVASLVAIAGEITSYRTKRR